MGKTFRPWTYGRVGDDPPKWAPRFWERPRPLFNLDQLANRAEAAVLVFEGEGTADAAGRLLPDLVATTSPGGAAAADWSSLRGRRVVVWPDDDDPGRRYAIDDLTVLGGVELCGDVVSAEAYLIQNDPVLMASQASIRDRAPLNDHGHKILPRMQVDLPIEVEGYRISEVSLDLVGAQVSSIRLFLPVGEEIRAVHSKARAEILKSKGEPSGDFQGCAFWDWEEGSKPVALCDDQGHTKGELMVWLICGKLNQAKAPVAPSQRSIGVDQGIRSKCASEWPGDYQMQRFCVDQQTMAWHQLHPGG